MGMPGCLQWHSGALRFLLATLQSNFGGRDKTLLSLSWLKRNVECDCERKWYVSHC